MEHVMINKLLKRIKRVCNGQKRIFAKNKNDHEYVTGFNEGVHMAMNQVLYELKVIKSEMKEPTGYNTVMSNY